MNFLHQDKIMDEKAETTREVNKHLIENQIKNKNEPSLGKIHEAPEYHRDNEYIHSGYRINFNSSWQILKSLFVLHNEFVNVWSHIIGVFIILFLILYTSLYIQSHKTEIINKWDNFNFNEDWNFHTDYFDNLTIDFKNTYEEGKDFLNKYAERITNTTSDYFTTFDEKMNEYKKYLNERINCVECLKNLMEKFSEMRDNFQINLNEMKTNFKTYVNMYEQKVSNMNISNYDFDFSKVFEEFNERLYNFKEEIMEKIDSQEMEWFFVYSNLDKKENANNKNVLTNKTTTENKDISNVNSINTYNYKRLRRWPLFIFLISAIICLSFSATFHLCYIHSIQMSTFLGKLDYAGISFLIAGSCFPPYYYLFYYSTKWLIFYLTFISTFALAVLIFSFRKDFGEPSKRALRGVLFLSFGISSALPIVHISFFSWTIEGNIPNITLSNWLIGGLCYIIGCLIYINRLPEKVWPGRFCIWGSSHQIWHFMVFSGIFFHFFACLDSYYDRLSHMNL